MANLMFILHGIGFYVSPGAAVRVAQADMVSPFKCPMECKQCCMSSDSGFHFECYLKSLFARRAKLFSGLKVGGYQCSRSDDNVKDGDIFTVCALGDESSAADLQDRLKQFDSQIRSLDKKLKRLADEATEASADPINAELDKEVGALEKLRKARDGSSKIFTDLNNEILTLENALLNGARPAPEGQSFYQIEADSRNCIPVSDAKGMMIQQKKDAIEKKKKEIATSEEQIKIARLAQVAAKKKLENVQREKADLLDDPEFADINAKVANLTEHKWRLQNLIDKGFPVLAHQLLQLNIAAERFPDLVQLLLRLDESESGEGGKERQEAFAEYVAPYSGSTIQDDGAKLEKLCSKRQSIDSEFQCSTANIREYFKDLEKELRSGKDSYDAVVDKIQKRQKPDDRNIDAILETMPRLQEKAGELGELIAGWQLENPLRFNEPLWKKYLKWFEDSEPAIGIYLKVTNQ